MASQATTAAAADPALPWHAAFPAVRDVALGEIGRDEVLQLIKTVPLDKRDFVLVDVRRNDHEGGTVRGSINLPVQSLHPTMPTLHALFKAAGVRKIIWYCGSCHGRGPRAAGWFRDYLADRGDGEMQSIILTGGIKGWAAAGGEFVEWMDGYDESAWVAED